MSKTPKLIFASAALSLAVLIVPTTVQAVISLTGPNPTYTENFDSIGVSGTVPPIGWFVGSLGANVTNGTFTAGSLSANTGTSTTGANYNYGTNAVNPATDRAIGSLASGTGFTRVTEARFTNNTGGPIIGLQITYDGEQYRVGTVANTLSLHFSLDGTTFSALGSGFNFTTPQSGSNGPAIDGNASANRVAGIGGFYSTTVQNSQTFYLRWVDLDDASSDAGIALDNFSLQAFTVPEPSVAFLLGLGGLLAWRRRK